MPVCPHCNTILAPSRIVAKLFLETGSLLYTCPHCTGQSQHRNQPLVLVLVIFGIIFALDLWLISHPGWLVIYGIADFIALWLALAYLPLEKVETPALALIEKTLEKSKIPS